MPPTRADQVLALVADDPEVKAAAKLLALSALEQAQYLLQYGNDVTKMRIIGSMLPAFQKSLTEDKTKSTEMEDLRRDFQLLRDEMMGGEEEDGTHPVTTD